MANYKLNTQLRSDIHKSVNKRLRKEGKIPAVYYFHREAPVPLIINLKELQKAIRSDAHIIELHINDKKHLSILRDLQHNPVTEEIIHADFMGITMKEDLTVNVPIVVEGSAIGVRDEGGVLAQHLWEIEVKCKANDIPDNFTIDVSDLNIGDSISVSDLNIENVEILTSISNSIISVVKATGMTIEEEAEEAEEGEEGEEGEETEESTEE